MQAINPVRVGETGPVPFRSSRFFFMNNEWYADTREGVVLGPYKLIDECREMMTAFCTFMTQAEPALKGRYLEWVQSGGDRNLKQVS